MVYQKGLGLLFVLALRVPCKSWRMMKSTCTVVRVLQPNAKEYGRLDQQTHHYSAALLMVHCVNSRRQTGPCHCNRPRGPPRVRKMQIFRVRWRRKSHPHRFFFFGSIQDGSRCNDFIGTIKTTITFHSTRRDQNLFPNAANFPRHCPSQSALSV